MNPYRDPGHPTDGVEWIESARLRQLDKGRTRWHDAQHRQGELLTAARVYLDDAQDCPRTVDWPWSDGEPNQVESSIKRLAHAGALIAAEIDRLLAEGERP